MGLAAADLDRAQKDAVLDHVRTTMGRDNYDKVVAQMGEDAVIDAFFKYAENAKASPKKKEKKGSWVFTIVYFCAQNGYIFVGLGWPGGVLWAACWLVVLGVWLIESPGEFGAVFGSILGIGVLGGVGFGLWRLSPWMFTGVRSWWGWLGSHF